jgi:hypothetical protein
MLQFNSEFDLKPSGNETKNREASTKAYQAPKTECGVR